MIARLYRAAMWLFPADFRERYAAEIHATAEQLERDRRGPRALAGALADILTTAAALRTERAPHHDHLPRESAMESLLQDIRFALRGLRRDPAFTAFAVLTLAVGIGANAAMFGIVDRLLLRGPDHVAGAARVVRLYVTNQPKGMRSFTGSDAGHVTYDLVRNGSRSFTGVATYANNEGTIGRGPAARPARIDWVSGSFFEVLGVHPRAGRFFGERENEAQEHVAVISTGLWMREFAGRDDAIGQTVVVSDEPFTIVGVAPAGFTGAAIAPVDVWVPMDIKSARTTDGWRTSWNAQWLTIVGRLRPGVTRESAGAELTRVFRAGYTGTQPSMRIATLSVAPLNANGQGSEATEARVARWLMGVSIIMLLVVCANVTNLLLARAVRRGRELAIRLALGSSAGRLRRLLVVESTLLGLAGAMLGMAVAYALGGIARHALLSNVAWSDSPVDERMLLLSFGIALAAGVVVGLVPAIRAGASDLTRTLKSGAGDGGGQRVRLRTALTVAQAAMSVALLIGAGLFVRSLLNARAVPLGIEPDRALIVELRRASLGSLADGPAKDAERARRRMFPELAVERLRGLPGVTHAAIAVGMPFGNRFSNYVRVPGRDSMPRLSTGGPSVSAVTPDYFATIGTRILRGRAFLPGDHAGTERVAIVSETMARTVWPNENPVGRCLIALADTTPCARIVGVAEDAHRGALREDPSMHFYIPEGQEFGFGGSVLLVRGAGDPRLLGPDVRRALMAMDGSLTYVDLSTVQDRIDPQMRPWKLGTSVLLAAGLLALLVAVVGIYSVTSYVVAMRRREIGVRVAVGASGGDILRLVLADGLATAVIGAVVGSVLALAGGAFLQPLLFDESARDPMIFIGVAGILIIASALACLVPGLRANRISPVEALRSE